MHVPIGWFVSPHACPLYSGKLKLEQGVHLFPVDRLKAVQKSV